MGSNGSPNSVLDRALEIGSVRSVHIAARACDHIPLDQAVDISLVFLSQNEASWDRVAARLLERLLAETRCSIEIASALAAALAGGRSTLPALAAILRDLGLERAALRTEAVVAGRRPLT